MALEDRSLRSTSPEADTKQFYTPGELARLFGVTPKTVSNWCDAGKLPSIVTPSGHRRIPASAIKGGPGALAGWQAMQRTLLAKTEGQYTPTDEEIAAQVVARRYGHGDELPTSR